MNSEFRDRTGCYMVLIKYPRYTEVWYIGFKNGRWSAEARGKLKVKDINEGLPSD